MLLHHSGPRATTLCIVFMLSLPLLERAEHPFTDNKNLTYLKTVKRLDAHQALWSLFFDWFKFAMSFHPESKNTKADALSH